MNVKNKFTLAIKLIGETILEIKFLHWDKRFLTISDSKNSCDDKFVYFISKNTIFAIYSSHDDGYIIDKDQYTIVIPDKTNMYNGFTITHNFESDEKRYNFLKVLYEYLHEWANTWEGFNDINDKMVDDIIVQNEYWVC